VAEGTTAKLPLLELMAASPDPIYGPQIGPGRFFNCCDLHIQINPGPGVTQGAAIERWGDVEIFVEALNGSVASSVYRRRLSTLYAERADQGPQLQGLIGQIRGRPAEDFRVWALNPNDPEAPVPEAELVMIAWGDPAASSASDQAGRMVGDQWCRPDQVWTWQDRLAGGTSNRDLRRADGQVFTVNPSGGRIMVTNITVGFYSSGNVNVELFTGPPAGPWTPIWILGAAAAQSGPVAASFSPPLVFLPGSVVRVGIGGTISVALTGFFE